jgi:hypothetical protein
MDGKIDLSRNGLKSGNKVRIGGGKGLFRQKKHKAQGQSYEDIPFHDSGLKGIGL